MEGSHRGTEERLLRNEVRASMLFLRRTRLSGDVDRMVVAEKRMGGGAPPFYRPLVGVRDGGLGEGGDK